MGRNSGNPLHSVPSDFFGYYVEDVSDDGCPLSPKRKSPKTKEPRGKFDQDMSPPSSSDMSPPSSSRLKTLTDSDRLLDEEDDENLYDDFDIEGVSKEEMAFWSQLAPVGQKLTDVETSPLEIQAKLDKAPSACWSCLAHITLTHHIASTSATKSSPSAAKLMNHFIRRHPFFAQQSLSQYTTSERRKFERDVYDFARAQSLSKAQAKAQTIKARAMCGEEEYDSENSALGDELDDSKEALNRTSAANVIKSTSSEVLPSIETKDILDIQSPGHQQICSVDAKEEPPKTKGNRHQTQTPQLHASRIQGPDRRTKVDKTVQEIKPKAQDSPLAQHILVAAEKSKVDPKAGRRERKKAKRQAAKDNSKTQESLTTNHNLSSDGAGPNNIVPPATKGPNDPKSETEAHKNFLISNERESHEHSQTAGKSRKDLEEAKKRSIAFDAELRASRDYINEHAIDLYNQGKYKGASKEMRDDLKGMAAERKAMNEDKANVAKAESTSKKRKKRKSVAAEEIEEKTDSKRKKRKSNGHSKPEDLPSPKISGFHSPMIQ
jgi:hypothetical protein